MKGTRVPYFRNRKSYRSHEVHWIWKCKTQWKRPRHTRDRMGRNRRILPDNNEMVQTWCGNITHKNRWRDCGTLHVQRNRGENHTPHGSMCVDGYEILNEDKTVSTWLMTAFTTLLWYLTRNKNRLKMPHSTWGRIEKKSLNENITHLRQQTQHTQNLHKPMPQMKG